MVSEYELSGLVCWDIPVDAAIISGSKRQYLELVTLPVITAESFLAEYRMTRTGCKGRVHTIADIEFGGMYLHGAKSFESCNVTREAPRYGMHLLRNYT